MSSRPTPRAKEESAVSSWLPKLTNLLALLAILFSSTQLGRHFWPASSLVYGIRVDYLSPTIYFLDILILSYLLAARPDLSKLRGGPLKIILPILLTNLFFSVNPLATLSWSLHFLFYLVFILSLSPYMIHASKYIILFSMLFQVVLASAQVALGHTLQGPLYYLGERALSVGQPAVASGSLLGRELLRAYGTFSHPNILAGWLVVCLLIVLRLTRSRHTAPLVTALVAVGTLLTQSRSAALSLFGLLIPLFLIPAWRPRLFYLLCLLSFIIFLPAGVLTERLDLSVGERLDLQRLSLQTLVLEPIFGTGAQASITAQSTLPRTRTLGITGLQPDHNSATLLLSWLGPVGAAALLFFLITKLPNHHLRFYDFLPLLPLLLLDHYFLTSPQGLFILLLYLRVTMSYEPPAKNHLH